ncbi:hypothetical protein FRX31_032710 [Thalictrum thalictroides]|uniref:Uncharacterized protein n=1 Tax=Thalictrum thalictroides TaxID=46969 RepID=A0A7J6UYG8_THATH|nr:hypothetical protein FRX31_032710 [Thalictrum thalictroides]
MGSGQYSILKGSPSCTTPSCTERVHHTVRAQAARRTPAAQRGGRVGRAAQRGSTTVRAQAARRTPAAQRGGRVGRPAMNHPFRRVAAPSPSRLRAACQVSSQAVCNCSCSLCRYGIPFSSSSSYDTSSNNASYAVFSPSSSSSSSDSSDSSGCSSSTDSSASSSTSDSSDSSASSDGSSVMIVDSSASSVGSSVIIVDPNYNIIDYDNLNYSPVEREVGDRTEDPIFV